MSSKLDLTTRYVEIAHLVIKLQRLLLQELNCASYLYVGHQPWLRIGVSDTPFDMLKLLWLSQISFRTCF